MRKSNLMIAGGLFIGMGIGMVYDQVPAGIFIGLGVGFILSTAIDYLGKKNH